MNSSGEIWEGDKLERKSEALMLEKFLTAEAATLKANSSSSLKPAVV